MTGADGEENEGGGGGGGGGGVDAAWVAGGVECGVCCIGCG